MTERAAAIVPLVQAIPSEARQGAKPSVDKESLDHDPVDAFTPGCLCSLYIRQRAAACRRRARPER